MVGQEPLRLGAHLLLLEEGQGGEVGHVVHVSGREPEVAELVARFGGSPEAVAAAWLHDTVEDCPPTSFEEIGRHFGPAVCGIVAEVTDDRTLGRAVRKRRQVEAAPGKSPEAALIKLCDKISNVRSVGETPPVNWSRDRRVAYLDWAVEVVAALPAVPGQARAHFATVLAEARAALGQG